MLWTAKPTGDMTLSVLDEKGQQILCVKMLSYGTMKAGDGGEKLARTMNDLSVLARFGSGQTDIAEDDLPQPEAGISPLPWSVRYDPAARRVVIIDGKKKRIAERDYPAKMDPAYLNRIIASLTEGCRLLKPVF